MKHSKSYPYIDRRCRNCWCGIAWGRYCVDCTRMVVKTLAGLLVTMACKELVGLLAKLAR